MDWWQAIVLGVVEGLTEYLPVSSTGHLILAQRAMGVPEGEAANAFVICIQAGAIVAVLGLYAKRVRQMAVGTLGVVGLTRKRDDAGFRLAVNIGAAFLPAAVVGVLLDDWIEATLFGLWPIVFAWFVGGAAILAVAMKRGRPKTGKPDSERGMPLERLRWQMAVAIGVIQCLAMWPGTSRSLVTIVGGVLVGLSLAAAVEFSFLLGVVTLCAATVYKLEEAGPVMLETYGLWPMVLGSVSAWVSAVAAVTWMVTYLKRHGMAVFGYYRIVLAVMVAVMIAMGWLSP